VRGVVLGLMFIALWWGPTTARTAQGEELPEGLQVAKRINEHRLDRPIARRLTMKLVDPKGSVRTRKLESFRREKDDASQIAIYVLEPPSMKGTGFLSYDYFDSSRGDDQWIYEPRRQAVRRVAESGRGEYFLGSEYTIEDIKKVNRIEIGEYHWKVIGREQLDGESVYLLEQLPRSDKLIKSLGYSRILNYVSPTSWLRKRIEYWDPEGAPLKHTEVRETLQLQGKTWIRETVTTRLDTGHRTHLRVESASLDRAMDDEWFTIRGLAKEIRR